jgi:hypothetical protein
MAGVVDWLLSRGGCSSPANASGCDTHRDSIKLFRGGCGGCSHRGRRGRPVCVLQVRACVHRVGLAKLDFA